MTLDPLRSSDQDEGEDENKAAEEAVIAQEMTEEVHAPGRALRSFSGAGNSIGGFIAGLEQLILHNRPPAAVVLEEHSRSERTTIDGIGLKLPEDWPAREEPPDKSGARL
jgi:hypothetical protein